MMQRMIREHVTRVVTNARRLAGDEQARLEIVIPAAWLRFLCPKILRLRSQASRLAADAADPFCAKPVIRRR